MGEEVATDSTPMGTQVRDDHVTGPHGGIYEMTSAINILMFTLLSNILPL